MTRQRVHGDDTPFGAWLREQAAIDSVRNGVTAHDVDMMLHKYKDNVDGLGRRTVHLLMNVEVKTRGSMPAGSQQQTLWIQHQLLDKRTAVLDVGGANKIAVWHFGYFVLSLSGSRPDDSDVMMWSRFDDCGDLIPRPVTTTQLVNILGFTVHPVTLQPMELRRHHKTSRILMRETTPLGLVVDRVVTRRS